MWQIHRAYHNFMAKITNTWITSCTEIKIQIKKEQSKGSLMVKCLSLLTVTRSSAALPLLLHPLTSKTVTCMSCGTGWFSKCAYCRMLVLQVPFVSNFCAAVDISHQQLPPQVLMFLSLYLHPTTPSDARENGQLGLNDF